jgi:hypothetical protein
MGSATNRIGSPVDRRIELVPLAENCCSLATTINRVPAVLGIELNTNSLAKRSLSGSLRIAPGPLCIAAVASNRNTNEIGVCAAAGAADSADTAITAATNVRIGPHPLAARDCATISWFFQSFCESHLRLRHNAAGKLLRVMATRSTSRRAEVDLQSGRPGPSGRVGADGALAGR